MNNAVLERYQKSSRRRRRAAPKTQRLDIQGLRMVAVLTVFANHLWGWPRGGFVGVDVFFVISGFLITGNLLRDAESRGTVSFRKFYWNRIRRIVPAATVVLALTYLASVLVFLPFRSHQIGVDALFAFLFMANWHFAVQGTDYFAASQSVSPLQHYWSLSIEEQFYFVWPALIFVISLVIVRKAWTHTHRMRVAAAVMAVVVVSSLAWAVHETAAAATWAYFDTFARVWELGVGALLACLVGQLARIPEAVKPYLSWAGLGLIAAALLLIGESSSGFPAPWALLPAAGAAAVIAAGVGGEPKHQGFLRNPISTYIGDVSYSLYLVHWPVIVLLGSLMDVSPDFYVVVLTLSFGLAIASYHFVETPLRRTGWGKIREATQQILRRRYEPRQSSRYAALGAAALLVVALAGYAVRPGAYHQNTPPPVAAVAPIVDTGKVGPLTTALHNEISAALTATQWPDLNPPLEVAINTEPLPMDIAAQCGWRETVQDCTWGHGPVKAVLIGDSVALNYAGPLRDIANAGRMELHIEAMIACPFADDLIDRTPLKPECPGRKQSVVDSVNTEKPDVVIISNAYKENRIVGDDQVLTPEQWADSVKRIIDRFAGSTTKIVLIAPPPADVEIGDCYGKKTNTPADCISHVKAVWTGLADAERQLASQVGGVWIDSRQWFCVNDLCPSFVGTTPTKGDGVHMTPEYGQKISPVITESLAEAGVF